MEVQAATQRRFVDELRKYVAGTWESSAYRLWYQYAKASERPVLWPGMAVAYKHRTPTMAERGVLRSGASKETHCGVRAVIALASFKNTLITDHFVESCSLDFFSRKFIEHSLHLGARKRIEKHLKLLLRQFIEHPLELVARKIIESLLKLVLRQFIEPSH